MLFNANESEAHDLANLSTYILLSIEFYIN